MLRPSLRQPLSDSKLLLLLVCEPYRTVLVTGGRTLSNTQQRCNRGATEVQQRCSWVRAHLGPIVVSRAMYAGVRCSRVFRRLTSRIATHHRIADGLLCTLQEREDGFESKKCTREFPVYFDFRHGLAGRTASPQITSRNCQANEQSRLYAIEATS